MFFLIRKTFPLDDINWIITYNHLQINRFPVEMSAQGEAQIQIPALSSSQIVIQLHTDVNLRNPNQKFQYSVCEK